MIEPSRPDRILDVGCGTGISTLGLHQALAGRSPNIYAIDISERMLLRARERCKSLPGVYFIRGRRRKPVVVFQRIVRRDLLYSLDFLLLPGFAESLRQASQLLLPGGLLSIGYYAGLFDKKGNDAVQKVFPDQIYQYGAVPIGELVTCLESLAGTRTTRIDYRFEVSRDFLFDFLSIPVQSSGFFPKVPYLDRIPKVRALCDLLVKRVDPVFMGWEFLIARKR